MLLRLVLSVVCLCSTLVYAKAPQVVNVYNWSDYIEPSINRSFTQSTKIKVRYDVFDSNEIMQGKLLTGKTGYDIVSPSHNFVPRQIKAGVYQPLNKAKLPNLKNLDPAVMKILEQVDPGNRYVVPYFWGINTLGINQDLVKKYIPKMPDNQWELLFNPVYVSKLNKCGVTLLDSPSEVLPFALHYLGKNPNSSNQADLQAAFDLLKKIRPYISRFSSSNYINDLSNGNICMALGFGGDINIAATRAREAKNGIKVQALVPKTGVGIWVDVFGILKDAKNTDEAYAYINYTLDSKIAAKNSNYITYATPVMSARSMINKDILNNPSIYLPPSALQKSFVVLPMTEPAMRYVTREWQRLKQKRK